MIRIHRMCACAAVFAAMTAVAATETRAQAPLFGGTLYGEFDAGFRSFSERPGERTRAYFEQYRNLPSGAVLPDARLWYVSEDGRDLAEFRARSVAQDDQRYGLTLERAGLFRFTVERDELPHTISTNGRMLGTETPPFTLPATRPDTATWNTAPFISPIFVGTTNSVVSLTVTPRPDWAVDARYSRSSRSGNRPMGMSFGSPGSNHREILEPVEHTTHNIRVAPTLTRPRYQLAASYDYSVFDNENESVAADNPLVATSTGSGSAFGRHALAPDNTARTLSASAGYNFNARTRLAGGVTYSWRSQNQRFVPVTSNSAVDTSALGATPAHLDGDARTTMAHLSFSTRPTSSVAISGRYRYFELDDRTPEVRYLGRSASDRSLSLGSIARHNYSHSRHSLSLDTRWRITDMASVRFSHGWEGWNRDEHVREREHTSEHTPKVTLSLQPTDWFSLRTSYLKGWRRGSPYTQVAQVQLDDLRKFDMADRDRERLDVAAEFGPYMGFDLGLTYGFGNNRYNASYGVEVDDSDILGADLGWTPISRVTFSASWLRQEWRARQNSRYRTPSPASMLNNRLYDWVSRHEDIVRSLTLGMNATVIERKLEVGAWYDLVRGRTALRAFNPLPPSGGTASTDASATAVDYPDGSYRINPWNAVVRYRLMQNWTVSVRYSYERFEHVDFRTDGLAPATGSDIFVGNDLLPYTARYVTFTVSYRPWIPGLRRPAY